MFFPFHYTYEDAHYEPVGQYINMCGYERDVFLSMLHSGINQYNYLSFSHYLHEYRHWIDHIGTVWGQDYMFEIIRYCNSKISNSKFEANPISPYKIHEILKAHGFMQHFQHSIVRTDSEIWKLNFNDQLVDQIPHFICTVLDYKGSPICNYPITFASLFEANARYEEIQCYLNIANHYLTSDEKLVEDILVHRKYVELSYDSDFIEYSIAASIPSALFQIDNAIVSYAVSSTLNTIILNLTPDMLMKLASVDRLGEQRIKHNIMFRNRDFGYILYYFCKLYAPVYSQRGDLILSEFLEFFELPPELEFQALVLDHMEGNKSMLAGTDYFFNNFNNNVTWGQQVIKARGIDSKRIPLFKFLFENEIRPHLIFGDEEWDHINPKDILHKPFEVLNQYERWTISNYYNAQ